MAYNTAKVEHYSLRTITGGNSQSFRVGDQYCPDNGWLLVWSCSNADQLTLRIQAKVAGPGHLSAEIINGADMSRHGLLAVPWPILDLDVSCDSADTDITLSAYAIDHQSGIGGWPSRIYRTERKTIASGATGDFDIPTGASKFWVGSTAAATVKLQDSAGDDIQGFALATGNVTIGAASSAPWYTTAEGGRVRITQSTGSNQTYAVVYEYDLTVGSGLA